jgi:hypothetical protein
MTRTHRRIDRILRRTQARAHAAQPVDSSDPRRYLAIHG